MEEKIKRTIYISSIDLKVWFMQAEDRWGHVTTPQLKVNAPYFAAGD